MRKLSFFARIFVCVALSGCSFFPRSGRPPSAVKTVVQPKASVQVADFENAAGQSSAGPGLRRMFIAALANSGRFVIADNQRKGQERPVDLVIAATVAEFEPQASGGTAGVGGGGGVGSGLMGGLLGATLNKAHVALEIRIAKAGEARVLAQTRVRGQAADVSGGSLAGYLGGWELDASLAGYANTPMEKAIRICIIEATRYVSKSVPEEYFKYSLP